MSSRSINVIALISAFVLIGSQAGLYEVTAEKDRAAHWVSHTYEAMQALTSIQTGMLAAEAALRGYAITHDNSLLPDFVRGCQQVREGFDRARELTEDNSHTHDALSRLEPQLHRRLDQLEDSLALARSFKPAIEVTTLDRVRLGMDIRAQIADLVRGEQELLRRRLERSAAETRRAQITALLGAALAAGLCALIFVLIRRQNVRLREAEEELRLTVDSAPTGIALIAPDGTLLRVNQALSRSLHTDSAELLRSDPRKLFAPDDVHAALVQAQRLIAGELATYQQDARAVREDGGEIWLHVTVSLVRSAHGTPRFFVCQLEDISDRKRAEEQAQLLARLTRLLAEVDDVPAALSSTLNELCQSQGWAYAECWTSQGEPAALVCQPIHVARDDAMRQFRKSIEGLAVVPPESLIGRVWSSGRLEWHEDLSDIPESAFLRRKLALQLGLRGCVAVPLFNQDGVEGVLLLLRRTPAPHDAPLHHLLSAVGGQLGMYIQRKRAQSALAASEARLNLASQATSDVIYDWDLVAESLWLGEAVQRNFGYDSQPVTSAWRERRIHPDDAQDVARTLSFAFRSGQRHWVAEYRFRRADDSYANVFDRGIILRDSSGAATRVIGSIMDISERVRTEQALREAKEAAEAGAQAKTNFLANMSHEIRTPLTALLGFADLMLEPNVGESERINYAMTIRRNGEHLLSVLNDILDVSMIEAGKLSIELVEFSPRAVLSEVAALMRVRALEKALDFSLSYDSALPELVRSDPTRVRQVVLNLLSNAVKFCERGSVRLSVRCDLGTAPQPTQLVLRVQDTGIGMQPGQVQRIFEPFAQADASTTRRFGGSGLGLAISARLASALGGKLEVETQPNVGSTFTFTVPVEVLQGSATEPRMLSEQAPSPQQGRPGNVLLAEDGPDNQALISALLRGHGVRVTVVVNGLLAVERALAAANSDEPFDVILMDMQMPELDGYGATARLRAAGYRGPIIALTAHAMAGERERCLAAGCDEYLTKPIRRAELLRTVDKHIQYAIGARAHTSAPLPHAGEITSAPANENATAIVSVYASDVEIGSLIERFVAALPERVRALAAAAERGDRKLLARLAHQLAGAAGGFGFPSITEAAKQLEQRAHDSSASCDAVLAELTSRCGRARAA